MEYPTRRAMIVSFLLGTGMLTVAAPLVAQREDPRVAGFPYARFQAHEATALWMVRYDRCGWVTSDLLTEQLTPAIQAQLGREWFCLEQGGRWFAVYGRFEPNTDRYHPAMQFRETDGHHFVRDSTPLDSATMLAFGRALYASYRRLPPAVTESRAAFNTFVRRDSVGAVEVWFLPAWQANGWLVYGTELRYGYDREGSVLLDSTALVEPLRGVPADTTRELLIDNEARELPTVGQTFFLLRYHRELRSVRVLSRGHVTTYFDRDGQQAWITAERRDSTKGP